MLAQGREAEKAKQELSDTQEKMRQLEESYERLKRRLDDKDAQIHKLRAALQTVQGGSEVQGVAAQTNLPAPDDYYAPPQPAMVPQQAIMPQQSVALPVQPAPAAVQESAKPPVQQPVPMVQRAPPVQQPLPQVQQPVPPVQPPRRAEGSYTRTAKPEAPPAPRHTRREQEYYDYLFGPVTNTGPPVQQQKERPKYQPQPAKPPAAEPRVQYQQWAQQQYAAKPPQPQPPPRGYYDALQQYSQPAGPPVGQYDKGPQPVGAHFAPEPQYPQEQPDEFIPGAEPEKVQMLNVVEIVNGLPVSQSQVLRRSR